MRSGHRRSRLRIFLRRIVGLLLGRDEGGLQIGFANGDIDLVHQRLQLVQIGALKRGVELLEERRQSRGRIGRRILADVIENEVTLVLSTTDRIEEILGFPLLLCLGKVGQVLLIVFVVAKGVRKLCGFTFDLVRISLLYGGLQSADPLDVVKEIG